MKYSISFEDNEAIQSIRSMANINLIEIFNLKKKYAVGVPRFDMNPHGCMPVHVDSCGFMCTPVHLGFSHDFT